MTFLFFSRSGGTLPCPVLHERTPERDRMAGLMEYDAVRWRAIEPVMPVCPRWAAPGQKIKMATRAGLHYDAEDDV